MRKKEGKHINCLKCGKKFYTVLSRYLSGRSKYCSVSCATYGRLGKSWSGEANERRSITLKTKMQNGEIKKRIGENHPMWKGGKEVLKEYWRPIKRHWLAKKRAKLKNAMPKWLSENDMIEIKNIYKKAAELSKLSNVKYHVDHIIPLNGKNVSGFHVPNNLKIITARENLVKNNKYEP